MCFQNRIRVLQRAGNFLSLNLRFSSGLAEAQDKGTSTIVEAIWIDGTQTAAQEDHMTHLNSYTEILQLKAKDLARYQAHEIEKEGEFKDVIEQTNNIIQWCAMIETIVFVVIGLWQIWSLRQFFIKRNLT